LNLQSVVSTPPTTCPLNSSPSKSLERAVPTVGFAITAISINDTGFRCHIVTNENVVRWKTEILHKEFTTRQLRNQRAWWTEVKQLKWEHYIALHVVGNLPIAFPRSRVPSRPHASPVDSCSDPVGDEACKSRNLAAGRLLAGICLYFGPLRPLFYFLIALLGPLGGWLGGWPALTGPGRRRGWRMPADACWGGCGDCLLREWGLPTSSLSEGTQQPRACIRTAVVFI
jgi:hypothetical protein